MTTVNKHSGSSNHSIHVKSSRRTELKDVTEEVKSAVRDSGCNEGVCHLYVPHTTAGVLINEGYDPAVAREIEAFLDRLVPRVPNSQHHEGNYDYHIKTALVGSSTALWVKAG